MSTAAGPMVRIELLEEGVARLELQAAGDGNRLTEQVCEALMSALDTLAGDAALRVLILAGGREVFCAGASLETLMALTQGRLVTRDVQLPGRLMAFPVPIIAALEGHAVGGGLMLALCCDMVIAAEERRYGFNFAELGFVPGMGATALLPALVGHFQASEMLLTGRFYRGRELRDRGLFNEVVPSAAVGDAAISLARRIADKPRPVVEMLKETLAMPRRIALAEAMSREHLMHRICFSDPKVVETIRDRYPR